MEEETTSLHAVDGKTKEAMKGRADGPKFVIKSALGENDGGTRRTTAVSGAWRRSAKWLNILAGQTIVKESESATHRLRSYVHLAPEVGGARHSRGRASPFLRLGDRC